MEHAGAIFYNASGLLLDQSATQNQLLGRASVIAHETAHMWFGDLVTMRWFNDVWMKEVFANFMAAKIVNPSFPEINHELRFLLAHYPAAYDVDRTPGTNAIRQPLDNLNEAGTLYGAIIYQKAPIVMRQLETILGETPFRDGLREYLRAHRFANATWPDLIALLDARTPEDLAAWSRAWVEEPGRPVDHHRAAASERPDRAARVRHSGSDRAARAGLERSGCRCWSPPTAGRARCRVTPRERSRRRPGRRAACRRRASCCRPAAASATAASCSIGAAGAYLLAHLPDGSRIR